MKNVRNPISLELLGFKMKILQKAISLFMLFPSSAFAGLLSNGVPPHSLGYADDYGYLLYTNLLFDLELMKTDVNDYPATIPMRLAFYTTPKHRKSVLLDAYWSFPIFDSYLAKVEENLIYWQTPDLNLVKFRPGKTKDSWETYGGYNQLKILKNGDYLIEETFGKAGSDELTYGKNGLIKKIVLKRNQLVGVFNIARTANSMVIRDKNANIILSLEKTPSSDRGSKSIITLKSGDKSYIWHTNESEIFSGNIGSKLELISKSNFDGEESLYVYESGKNLSKMSILNSKNETEKMFEWNSENGRITKDWLGAYSIEAADPKKKIKVERSLPWAVLSFENIKENSITRTDYNNFSLTRYVIGNGALAGRTRKLEIFNKEYDSPIKSYRYFYDKDGNETIKRLK